VYIDGCVPPALKDMLVGDVVVCCCAIESSDRDVGAVEGDTAAPLSLVNAEISHNAD